MTDRQATFDTDGTLETDRDAPDDADELTKDDGTDLSKDETCGGFNRYDVSSLLQKAVRRSDRERAMWAAWELCRSGYAWNFWDRAEIMLLEDLRLPPGEAHLLDAVERLRELAHEKWSPHEGMGLTAAMRAASLLAEAESGRELFGLKGRWEAAAPDRMDALNRGEEPDRDFPVDADGFGDLGYQVLDMHTYDGKVAGRNTAHFLVTSSRTSELSDLEREYKRRRMADEPYEFTDEQLRAALTPTAEQDDPWDDDVTTFPRD